jgi:uncharacterized phage-associated protein
MTDVFNLAEYIINYPEIYVDNLKLQKLLFYCQAVSLAINKKPIFNNRIEAWDYGPVVPEVYAKYRNGDLGIEKSDAEVKVDPEDLKMADLALDHYGSMSGSKLIQLTHSERPWQDAYKQGRNTEITQQAIQKFYSTIYRYE